MNARQLAAQWRANPSDRLRIEREIAVSGRWSEFRFADGQLVARMSPEIRAQINGAGVHIRKGQWLSDLLSPEMVQAAGAGIRSATFDGELINQTEANKLRGLGRERRAA
jgi:hypothetical protein